MRKVLSTIFASLFISMFCISNTYAYSLHEIKGVWLSYIDYQDLLKGKNEAEFKDSFIKICVKCKKYGLNSIFVHVRSHNDAIYPSDTYPWSDKMLSGTNPGYDPLEIMVKIAHANELDIHAWINPYGYRNGVIEDNSELATTPNIVSGVEEILSNYEVDGIHFDDYFPPFGEKVLNNMVHKVHDVCKKYGVLFGISPQGNVDNNLSKGADVITWLSNDGYVDYIAPQIYWTDMYKDGTIKMSSNRLKEWMNINKNDIPIYVGMALYRSGNLIESDPGWLLNNSNLSYQYEYSQDIGYDGFILFNTKCLMNPNESQKKELVNLRRCY